MAPRLGYIGQWNPLDNLLKNDSEARRQWEEAGEAFRRMYMGEWHKPDVSLTAELAEDRNAVLEEALVDAMAEALRAVDAVLAADLEPEMSTPPLRAKVLALLARYDALSPGKR
jgi:hypothetical protein